MNKKYNDETIKNWGNTDLYKEFTIKTKDYSIQKYNEINENMNYIFKQFSILLNENKEYNHINAQNLVKTLKEYISENLYTCNNEMLLYLGSLYVSDPRYKKNIDIYCDGNAEFINNAIKFFYNNN